MFLCLFSVLSVPDDNRSTTHEKRVVSRFSCFPEVVQFGISKHWSTIFGGHRLFSYFSDFYVPLTDLGYLRTNGTFTVTQAETASPQDESLIHSHTGVTTGRITHSQSHRTNHSFTVTQAETGSPQDESLIHSHTGRNRVTRGRITHSQSHRPKQGHLRTNHTLTVTQCQAETQLTEIQTHKRIKTAVI